MIRPLKLQIAIIVLVAMAGILALRQAQGQAMSPTAGAAGAPANNGTTRAPEKQETKPASTRTSSWTAGTTNFASQAKGAWGGGPGFSAPKSAWTPGKDAVSQGAQPGGVWRTPNFSALLERASSAKRSEAESFSAGPATSRFSISGMGLHRADKGSRQFGAAARQFNVSSHRFGMPLQGKSNGKPTFPISEQRFSFTATRPGGIPSMRGKQPGPLSAGQHGTTGLGNRPSAPSAGLGQHRLGSSLGGTGSGFDPNSWDPQLNYGQKPQ